MKFLIKIAILLNLMDASFCTSNNAPEIDNRKVWDCSQSDDVCSIKFVVEPFMSMTYYELKDKRELRGRRAYFNSEGDLVLYGTGEPLPDTQTLNEPITTDGEFRPLITVNGRMPGPTIIARKDQMLHVTVYNELPNVEGISIHWHGIHQKGTPEMDGVAFITQYPILPYQSFTYKFRAFPSGTHWYHAHSGAHRTDGLYGALIVKDTIAAMNGRAIIDLPANHTLLLMDWQKDPSIDLFYQIRNSLSFWNDARRRFQDTVGIDNTQIGPIPFWSGIINDKGRHFDQNGQPNNADLNVFHVRQGSQYRFRLIGAQALYAYKFSIQGHILTVVATDGNRIDSITDVHYVIVNTGERYDVIVDANQRAGKYWILAETLEVEGDTSTVFHNPIRSHRAEAILQYEGADAASISLYSYTWDCTVFECRFVNCPYLPMAANHVCINVDQFRSLEDDQIDDSIYNPKKTLFYNFGFDGEKSTNGSSVDGINFRFPSHLLGTKESAYDNQICPGRGCDHDTEGINHCACTQVIDINDVQEGQSVELVITNRPSNNTLENPESSHPVHLHGHTFYVVELGYPRYNSTDGIYASPNQDVECVKHEGTGKCNRFITADRLIDGQYTRIQSVRWTNGIPPPDISVRRSYVKKDTVIVPYGGYAVIRFTVDNPGWWFLHCHIEIHQLEGMSTVIKELQPKGQGLIEKTDVTFVVDTSGSVGRVQYEYAKDFMRSITEAMNIGQFNSRVAVIIFNHATTIYCNLNQNTDKNQMIEVIRNIPYYGGNTSISQAVNFLATVAQNGSLRINRDNKQVAIFVTDGLAHEDDDVSAAAISLRRIRIFDELFAVGVGYANVTVLRLLVTSGSSVYYQLPFTEDTIEYYSQRVIGRLEGSPQNDTATADENDTATVAENDNGDAGTVIAIIVLVLIILVLILGLLCTCCCFCCYIKKKGY